MGTFIRLVLILMKVYTVLGDAHYIEPKVELVSCVPRTVNIMIDDFQEGGIMYVRHEKVTYNMQPTINGSILFSCLFEECMVEYNREFLFIIQRKPTVQTRHDVVMLFTCNTDLGDLTSGDQSNSKLLTSSVYMYLIRATASLKFYNTNTSQELASGSYVKLGTAGRAVVALEDTYEGTLDITVKSCEASGIPLIENRCPVDADLFGMFGKTSLGVLESNFSMFRSTSLGTGPINMVFTCVLEVCYAPCAEYVCNGTEPVAVSYRRKRSDNREGEVAKNLSVATLFSVGLDDPVYVAPQEPVACITEALFTVVICILALLLCASLGTTGYILKEWLDTRLAVREKTSIQTQTQQNISSTGQLPNNPVTELCSDRENKTTPGETVTVTGCLTKKFDVQSILDSPRLYSIDTRASKQPTDAEKSTTNKNYGNGKSTIVKDVTGKIVEKPRNIGLTTEKPTDTTVLRKGQETQCSPKITFCKDTLSRTSSVPVTGTEAMSMILGTSNKGDHILSTSMFNKAYSSDMLNVIQHKLNDPSGNTRSCIQARPTHLNDKKSNANCVQFNVQPTQLLCNAESKQANINKIQSYGNEKKTDACINLKISQESISQANYNQDIETKSKTVTMPDTNPTIHQQETLVPCKKPDASMQQKCVEEMMVKFQACMRAGRRHSSLQKTESIRSLINAENGPG